MRRCGDRTRARVGRVDTTPAAAHTRHRIPSIQQVRVCGAHSSCAAPPSTFAPLGPLSVTRVDSIIESTDTYINRSHIENEIRACSELQLATRGALGLSPGPRPCRRTTTSHTTGIRYIIQPKRDLPGAKRSMLTPCRLRAGRRSRDSAARPQVRTRHRGLVPPLGWLWLCSHTPTRLPG